MKKKNKLTTEDVSNQLNNKDLVKQYTETKFNQSFAPLKLVEIIDYPEKYDEGLMMQILANNNQEYLMFITDGVPNISPCALEPDDVYYERHSLEDQFNS
jgi:hypothetical protein